MRSRAALVLSIIALCFVTVCSDLTLTETEMQTGLVDRHREALIKLASETSCVFVIRVTDPTARLFFLNSIFTLTSLERLSLCLLFLSLFLSLSLSPLSPVTTSRTHTHTHTHTNIAEHETGQGQSVQDERVGRA